MKRKNKYLYLWVIQGWYGSQYGWEDVDQSENWRDARDSLKSYRENETNYSHRMIQRRELND